MNSYRLTERADRDVIEIFLYGLQNFGLAKVEQYRNSLTNCFDLLAENPRLGRGAGAIAPGVRRHEHGSHIILYEQESCGVTILALVHVRSVRDLQID